MDSSINLNLSPIQLLISLAFEVWMIVFPIIIIRKLNYLIGLLETRGDHTEEA